MTNLLAGSPVVGGSLLLLILFSMATWSIIVLKLWQQRRDARLNRDFNQRFWAAQTWQAAAQCTGDGQLASLAQAGFAALQVEHHLSSVQDSLERGLRQCVQNVQRDWESGLTVLASIGSTAPFVGLFGTVWGIMHALQSISQRGSASLDVVAGPIGEALIATAIGIATALPAVLAYNFFLRRLKLAVTELENFAHDFMRLAAQQQYRGA